MSTFFSLPYFDKPFYDTPFFKGDYFKKPFFGGLGSVGTPPVTKPAKPASISETGKTETSIQIGWAAVADAASYNIAITPAVTGYPKDISTTSDHTTGLTKDTAYTFKVKACNTAGCSATTQKTITTANGTNP